VFKPGFFIVLSSILASVPAGVGQDNLTNAEPALSLTDFRWASGFFHQLIIDFRPSIDGYGYSEELYAGKRGDTDRGQNGRLGFFLQPRYAVEVMSDSSETFYGCSAGLNPSFEYSSSSNHRLSPLETGEWSSSRERSPFNPSFSVMLSGYRSRTIYPGVFHLGYSLSGTVGYAVGSSHDFHRSDSMLVDNFNPAILSHVESVRRDDRVSSELTAYIHPDFTCGLGRIYDATPLFAAMRIIDGLRNHGLLAAEPSRDEMKMLAVLCRTNIKDNWDDRENHIARISRISEFLGERGCLKEMNPESVLRIRDSLVWLPPRILRKHGSRLQLVLSPAVSARYRTASYKEGPDNDSTTVVSNGVLLSSYSWTSSNWRQDAYRDFVFAPAARISLEVFKPASRRLQFDQSYLVYARLGEGTIVQQVTSNSYGVRHEFFRYEWRRFVSFEPRALISVAWLPSDRWTLQVTSEASGHLMMNPKMDGSWILQSPSFGERLSFDVDYSLRQELIYAFGAAVNVGFNPGSILNTSWNLSGSLSYRIF
jgi:hypothetical protein